MIRVGGYEVREVGCTVNEQAVSVPGFSLSFLKTSHFKIGAEGSELWSGLKQRAGKGCRRWQI
jgi:hypothetical protein